MENNKGSLVHLLSAIHLLTTVLGMLFSCYIAAQESFTSTQIHNQPFQVEMIVFQHETKPDDRWWPPIQVNPFAKLINPPIVTVSGAKRPASKQKNQLSDSLQKLQQSHKYNVLFYSSWKQQVQTTPLSSPTLLKAGEQYGEHHELIGSVGLARDKQLQLTLDFWWREFDPILPGQRKQVNPSHLITAGPEQTKYQIARNFHFQQQQPLQPNQIYYVDSPVLGMLVLLTPVSQPVGD